MSVLNNANSSYELSTGKRCAELGPWLSSYLDGELEGLEQTPFRCRIEEHLQCCSACAQQAAFWLEDAALLSVTDNEVPAAPWFQQKFASRLREIESGRLVSAQEASGPLSGLRRFFSRALPVIVVIVGLVLGVLLRIFLVPGSTDPELVDGFGRLERSTLASTGAFTAGDQVGDVADFDEVLRPMFRRQIPPTQTRPAGRPQQVISESRGSIVRATWSSADLTGAGRSAEDLAPIHRPVVEAWQGRPEKNR